MDPKIKEKILKQLQNNSKKTIPKTDNKKIHVNDYKCQDLFIEKVIRFPSQLSIQAATKSHLFINYKLTKLQTTNGNIQLLKKMAQQQYKKQQQQQSKDNRPKKQMQKQVIKDYVLIKDIQKKLQVQCLYCGLKCSIMQQHLMTCLVKRRHLLGNFNAAAALANVRAEQPEDNNNNNNNNNGFVTWLNFNNRNQANSNNNNNQNPLFNNAFLNQLYPNGLPNFNPNIFNNLNIQNLFGSNQQNNESQTNQQNQNNQDNEQNQSNVASIGSQQLSENSQQLNSIESNEQMGDQELNDEVTQKQENNEVKVVVGYSLRKLKQLKVIKYEPKDQNQKIECNICSQDFINDEKMLTLKCQHSYHQECAKLWLEINKTCPTCNLRTAKKDIFH